MKRMQKVQPELQQLQKQYKNDKEKLMQEQMRIYREHGVNPGYAFGRDYPEHQDCLLVALTERRTRADIDRLAEVLAAAVAAERRGVEARA